MNTHLAGEPIEVKMLIKVQVGETPTSPTLPELSLTSLPYYSTSYLGPKPLEWSSKVECSCSCVLSCMRGSEGVFIV